MGKKKGKDKNKLARMSEEERQRYLQHRADMEEEAKRRKQQLIATFMKNKLKKEEAFSRINIAKINLEWREILRKLTCKELCNNINAVKKDCDQNIQRKNTVIRRLLCDLDESEEIYSTMLNFHSNTIEQLLHLHKERLNFFKNEYEIEKSKLLEAYKKDMNDYKNKKFQMQKELESVYYGLSERTLKTIKSGEEEFMQRTDELKNSMMIKLETITKERELHMEKLWKEFQTVLVSYLLYIEEYRDEYIDLRNRDAEDTRSIQDHYSEVSKLTDKIVELKSQLLNVKDEQDFNINQLVKHKTDLKLRMDKIKENMENGLINDKEKLKSLSYMGSVRIKKLQNILKNGNAITQLIRFCENYDDSKLMESGIKKKFLENSESDLKKPPIKVDVSGIYDIIDNFWMRHNRTKIDCVCLQEEKNLLKAQNKHFKVQLKHYLISLNMSNGQAATQSKTNDRFTNRPSSMKIERIVHISLSAKSQLNLKKKVQQRPLTCIEGSLSNAVRYQART